MFSRLREICGNLQHPRDQVDRIYLKGLSELVVVMLRRLREEACRPRGSLGGKEGHCFKMSRWIKKEPLPMPCSEEVCLRHKLESDS